MRRANPRDLGFLTSRPFAHRGLHGAGGVVENTRAAFGAAIAAGHGIELDVRITADRLAAVFHDEALDRLTGIDARVDALPMRELAAMRLASSAETIPAIGDAIDLIAGQTPTLIEIKSPGQRSRQSLCRAIRRAIEGAHGWTAIMSFDPFIVRWFRDHSPQTARGLVITQHGAARTRGLRGWIARNWAVRYSHPHFLAYDIRSLPCGCAARFRKSGRPVLTWTVRGDDERARASLHADQIIFEQTAIAAT